MTDDHRILHCDYRFLAEMVRELGLVVGACIVDAPYSDKTHKGHDQSSGKKRDTSQRASLDYAAWGEREVNDFVDAWSPITHGWFCTLTDHVLAPVWSDAMARCGRYVFSPIACVEPGSRVRIRGDGPAQWSTLLVVARPRTRGFADGWGALPGAYVVPEGHSRQFGSDKKREVIGGKNLWTMERIVSDYSRPGDLVIDPCCGAGTTCVAAARTGRRSIGGDVSAEHALIASEMLRAETELTTIKDLRRGQVSLFG